MTRIDVGSVLRHSANLPYTDLVTRTTGAAVRRCIEIELQSLQSGDVAMLDFSHIGMMDYSCADEVVAKLLIAHADHEAPMGFFVFHGITDAHLEAIEEVLDHHGLALVVHFADGGARLVGTVSDAERSAWNHVYLRGPSAAEELATAVGGNNADVAPVLDSLLRRRLLRLEGAAYVPVGPLQ